MGMFIVLQAFVRKESFETDVFDLMMAPDENLGIQQSHKNVTTFK